MVGFKSVVAYRTGLDIDANASDSSTIGKSIIAVITTWQGQAGGPGVLRLADKPLNDFVVHTALSIATAFNKPGESSLTLIQSHGAPERKRALI